MKTNLTEQIEKLQSELDRLKELNNQCEPKDGEWWWGGFNDDYLALVSNHHKNGHKCYFNGGKILTIDKGWFSCYTRKATDSEVCDAFKRHLETNGWTKGCKFKSAVTSNEYIYDGKLYADTNGMPVCNFGTIFSSKTLTLAELVKEEKISVYGEEVQFYGNLCLINGTCFDKEQIKRILTFGVDTTLFTKILKKMESVSE